MLHCDWDDTFLSWAVKVRSRQRVGFLSTSFSFHICPQRASEFLPVYLCIELFLTPRISACVFLCVCACVCVWSLMCSACEAEQRSWPAAVCTNIGCGGGLRGSRGEVGRHGPTLAHASAHARTHTLSHTHTQGYWSRKHQIIHPPPARRGENTHRHRRTRGRGCFCCSN